jgi:hypothetical protein
LTFLVEAPKLWVVRTKDLLAVFGTQEAVGKIFTPPISKSAVSQWGENVPELRAYQIHEAIPDINKRIRTALKAKQAA